LKVFHQGEDQINVNVYKLAPLRQLDVSLAAEQHGIDPVGFLRAIKQRGIAILATIPFELEPLLEAYKVREGHIPSTQVELYLDRCRRLCGEWDPRRSHTIEHYKHTTRQQRLAIAARIAAVTIFSGRPLIYNDVNYRGFNDDQLAIEELSGRIEHTCDDPFYVSEEVVQETMETGLFSFAQNQLMAWEHRTYSEFLAAWYVAQNMSTKQIESLVFHSSWSEWKVFPQLSETAAWLAAMDPRVFNKIVTTDPEILLQRDVTIVDFNNRARLVEALLELYRGQKHLMIRPGSFEWYRKLDFEGLDQQISRYLSEIIATR
jgi:hypothetical protein